MDSRFYLIGYMASGKSFLGRTIAGMLDLRFLDLDHEIEAMAGMSIPEIFSSKGEGEFRAYESRALKRTGKLSGLLVATGGGTPCFGDHMEWMNAHGETIFLDAPVEVIADRILRSKRVRPLVEQISREDLPDFIRKHLEGRLQFYRKAKHTLSIQPERETNIRNLFNLMQGMLPD